MWIPSVLVTLLVAATAATPASVDARGSLLLRLESVAPDLDPKALTLALEARDCAIRDGAVATAQRLAVIDYSRPSTERRLWVFDVAQARLLYREYVAHGRGSGENFATRFSNASGSHQSSLGLFRTADTYQGSNGYSLRMDGLEAGINDQARARAIVMHGARYVDPGLAGKQGRLGRSYGCPALRTGVAREVIDTLKQGQLIFAYYPDLDWQRRSRLLGCGASPVAGR